MMMAMMMPTRKVATQHRRLAMPKMHSRPPWRSCVCVCVRGDSTQVVSVEREREGVRVRVRVR